MNTKDIIFGEKKDGISYRARTGVYGVALDNGKTTIVHIPTGYFLIGGGIEEGEKREECLQREFEEETGYSICIGEYIGKASGYYYSEGFGQYMFGTGHFYRVQMLEKIAEPIEKDHALVTMDIEKAVELIRYDYQRWALQEACR